MSLIPSYTCAAECSLKTYLCIIYKKKNQFIFGCSQRTTQMSSIQNLALHVGQGTLLDSQVSGLC